MKMNQYKTIEEKVIGYNFVQFLLLPSILYDTSQKLYKLRPYSHRETGII